MPVNIDDISAQTDALRQDYTFLEGFGVDAAKVRERSKVLELSFTENSATVQTFVKVYSYRKSPFQRIWRKGTARREARNLLFFKSIGIPTPRVIAWGQRRNALGKIIHDYIITEAVAGTQTLNSYMAQHCPDRSAHATSLTSAATQGTALSSPKPANTLLLKPTSKPLN